MIRPLALVFALLYPSIVSAAINVGPERPVAAPGFGIASGTQLDVSMATSGQETLVAWIDNTRGRTGAYVAALSPDVELIEGSQRWLAPDAFDVTITWTGSEYLALWKTPLGLVASTLDRDGNTLVAPRLVLNGVWAISNVAWAGSTGMVIYARDFNRIEAAILDRQGNVTRAGIAISSRTVRDARVGSDGTSFFIFWRPQNSARPLFDLMFVTRYTVDGTRQEVAPVTILPAGRLLEPWDVAFDGQRFAVVLSQRSGDTDTIMRRIVVDAATLESTTLAPIDLGTAGAAGVEWTGTHFLTSWMQHTGERTRELRTLAFSADGADGAPVSVLGELDPSVDADSVWNGRTLVVAWTRRDPVFFETDVLATAASGGGHRNRIDVSLSHRWQALAAIGTNGNESLVAWIDGSASNSEPRRIVSAHATGGVIDQAPRHYSETPMHEQPVVVFTGTMYLLLFNEIIPGTHTPHIALRRIDANGTPLDQSAIHVGYGFGFGAAWNGTHLLVAYFSGHDLDAVRIAHDGTIVDSTPSRIATGRLAYDLSMASNGTDFLLVWSEGSGQPQWPTPNMVDVHAVAISAAGNAIGAPVGVATGPSTQRLSAVASDGRDYAIVYIHDQTLTAKKVLREGTLANATAQDSGTLIAQAPFPYSKPAIAATPAGYMVAWELEVADQGGELWLARLDRNTAVAESPRAVARSGVFIMQPTLTPLEDGALDLAYSRLVDDPSYGATMRIFIRRVEEGATPGSVRQFAPRPRR
jgi:hypothetical protein